MLNASKLRGSDHGLARPGANRLAVGLFSLLVLAGACGRSKSSDPKPPGPAKVDKPVKEADLNTITLTPEAEKRLDVRTVPVEKRKVQRARTLGGEAVVPPGLAVTVSAPLGGALSVVGDASALRPGAAINKGQPIFALTPTITDRIQLSQNRASLAALRAEADAGVAKAQIDLEAAKITLSRAEQLARESIGSTAQLDDARSRQKLAEAALAAAEARARVLTATIGAEPGAGAPIRIEAPMSGVLLRVYAQPGQVVASGAPLFEINKLDAIWIRVPVYVGDLSGIDTEKEATIGALTGAPDQITRLARPVSAPPSANAASATVDLFYEIDNVGASLRPGQRVAATLAMRAEEESLVVPWSAVVHDIYGGSWVYEAAAPQAYARRRVQVRYAAAGLAALASGPKPGTHVVTTGAAELFGTELGTGK